MIHKIKSFLSPHNTLYILRFICRYYIALQLFSYAFGKILKTQFNLGLESALDQNISNFNGFALTWTYFGFSRGYGLVIAISQIIAALLLLFRRTERLGTILLLSFMINILFIDFFYEIDGAKSMAIRLTIMGFFLLFSDWKGFKGYFIKIPSNTYYHNITLPKEFKKIHFLKYILILSMIFYDFNYIYNIKKKYFSKNEVFGVWRNTNSSNGDSRMYKIFFDYRNSIKIRDFSNSEYYGKLTIDDSLNTITINAQHYSEPQYFMIQDSLQKRSLNKNNKKEIRDQVKTYYDSIYKTPPFSNMTLNYHIINDTLFLKDNSDFKLKMINITPDSFRD